jgi:hypothetical protein
VFCNHAGRLFVLASLVTLRVIAALLIWKHMNEADRIHFELSGALRLFEP